MSKKILCLGDSNTQGNGTEDSPYPHRYSNVLSTLLITDKHDIVITNYGASGKSSETELDTVNSITTEHYDVVTMMIGTNDVNFFYTDGNTPTQAAARHRVAINALLTAIRTKFSPDKIFWIIPISPRWGGSFTGLEPWTDLMQPTYNAIVAEIIDFCIDHEYEEISIIKGNLCIDNSTVDDYIDGIHVSISGAAKLAGFIRNYMTLKL